jgi:DNA-binding CsgD family transcriptional regulator
MTIVRHTSHKGEWVGPVVGRRAELDAVRQQLGDLSNGPAHLVFEGPAGIGKSTVWAAAVGLARSEGATVLATRPSIGDATVPWAGLSDLLGETSADALAGLTDPQRRAIEIVLSRREPESSPLDELSVRLGVRAMLQALAGAAPLVLAIDDLQWLDAATTSVLAFALKRVEPARVGLLGGLRVSAGDPLAEAERGGTSDNELVAALRDDAVTRVRVGPLEEDPLRAIVRDQVGGEASRSTVDDICRISGGNPLYAIELARSGDLAAAAGLRSVVEARFAGLPEQAQDIATVVAVAGPLGWADVQALAQGPVSERALDQAVRSGFLVSSQGRTAFTHPLLEAVVHASASEPTRQRLHRGFADRFPDSDETPRHLAACTLEPDSSVAGVLDTAADRARRRGAPRIAADLYLDAARLTADDPDALARREIEAALAFFAAGETAAARRLLEAVAERPESPRRAEALHRLAGVIWAAEGHRAGMEAFRRALPAAAGHPAIEGDIHDNLAWLVCETGDMPKAYEHVRTAREIAERLGDPALLASVLNKYGQIEFQIGRGPGLDSAARAIEYELSIGPAGDASHDRLVIMAWSDRLDEAREGLMAHLARARADGNVQHRYGLLSVLAIVEYRAGNWEAAHRYTDEAIELALEAGLGTAGNRRMQAMLDVVEGRPEQAIALVDQELPKGREEGDAWVVIRLLWIAGAAHLVRGDVERAADFLDEAWTFCEQVGVTEPGIFRTGADAVEALVAAGRLDRAEAVLSTFERQSQAVARPWGLATAARGRALLEAARGRYEKALAHAADAMARSEALGQPFELARAQLAAGTIERRAGQRREARARLATAKTGFQTLGAHGWAERTAMELGRISGRAPSEGALTPTEERVAALVAEGLTNQEVAGRLFVTVRTVETNLTRIYGKLGVRSRTELARHLPAAEAPEPEPALAR